MQLSRQVDYGLRLLLYLGAHADKRSPVADVSRAYGISRTHLAKIATLLADAGWVDATRGRHGGLSLAPGAMNARLSEIVRELEPSDRLVECFDRETNTCAIAPACRLRKALATAQEAFFSALDPWSLGDLLANRKQLSRILQVDAA